MPSVTVNLEDLETIVFATGAIKAIEGALASRKKNDPFVRPHLDFTEAHNRLSAAMRDAKRANAGTAAGWDEPLDRQEVDLLDKIRIVDVWFSPTERLKYPSIDSLMAKGCIVMGQFVNGILWAGADRPEVQIDPKGFPVKITDRGRKRLAEISAQMADAYSHVIKGRASK